MPVQGEGCPVHGQGPGDGAGVWSMVGCPSGLLNACRVPIIETKALRPAVGSAEVESYGSSRAGPVYLTAGPECAIIVSRIRHSGGVAPFRARSRP